MRFNESRWSRKVVAEGLLGESTCRPMLKSPRMTTLVRVGQTEVRRSRNSGMKSLMTLDFGFEFHYM